MRKIGKIMILLSIPFLFVSCFLAFRYKVPEGYVSDEEVIYLIQRVEYGPIAYEPVHTEPYNWDYEVEVNRMSPSFLKSPYFKSYLTPSLKSDIKLYKEISEHLLYIDQTENYLKLKELLESYTFIKPERRKIAKGELVKEYNNADEYEYPEIEGATISYFHDGSYKIELPGGNVYYDKGDYYFENDSSGNELYAYFSENDFFRIFEGDYIYRKNYRSNWVEGAEGELTLFPGGEDPQYRYDPPDSSHYYVFFINEKREIENRTLINEKAGMRYDYYAGSKSVTAHNYEEAITIDTDFDKYHKKVDNSSGRIKTTDIISIYYKDGVRITGFDAPLTYSTLNPAWPENYRMQKMADFNIFYTEKDLPLLTKLDRERLAEVYSKAAELTGLNCLPGRAIVLPPDLESYRKIHAGNEAERLNWYPSGFQTRDMIIMWPPSVKRYRSPAGESYFWEEEFYEILLHELVHLIVGENSGIFSDLPVWLNEGLAVYVEGLYSEESGSYWDITFAASRGLKRLLPWDDLAVNSTSHYPVAEARVHYAQSYKMVSYLAEQYGREKLAAYVKSFRTAPGEEEHGSPRSLYKKKFFDTFDLSWERNLENFEEYLKKNRI